MKNGSSRRGEQFAPVPLPSADPCRQSLVPQPGLIVRCGHCSKQLWQCRRGRERTEVGAFIHVLGHDRDGPGAPGQCPRCYRDLPEDPAKDKECCCQDEENAETGRKSTLHEDFLQQAFLPHAEGDKRQHQGALQTVGRNHPKDEEERNGNDLVKVQLRLQAEGKCFAKISSQWS
jgi:hypothetical protein